MNITTLVFIVTVVFFTWRGYQKGFIGAISRVLSFVIAYPAAIYFTKPFAKFLREHTALDGLLLFIVSGCTIFLGVSLAVTFTLIAIANLAPKNQFTETGSKIGGTVFGLFFGATLGLIAVYIGNIFIEPGHSTINLSAHTEQAPEPIDNETRKVKDGESYDAKKYPIADDSFIDATAKKIVSTAVSTAVDAITSDTTTTQITKTITQDPQATLNHIQNITNNGELKQLLEKPDFQAELNRGDVESLMKSADFQQLIHNPDMQAIIATSDDSPGGKSAEQATAEKMIQAWQKVVILKNDPRVINILSDPTFQTQLNSANKLPLLTNPKMRELTEIMFSSSNHLTVVEQQTNGQGKSRHYTVEDITTGTAGLRSDNITHSEIQEQEQQHEPTLYRWTDENGKLHYSDNPSNINRHFAHLQAGF